MKKILKYITILLLFSSFTISSKSNPIDSLEILISKAQNDSIKVELYIELAKEFLPEDDNYKNILTKPSK